MSHLVTVLSRKIKNFLPSFRSWTLHANAVVTSPYVLTLTATGTLQSTFYDVPVLPNQTYTMSSTLPTNGEMVWRFLDVNKTQLNALNVTTTTTITTSAGTAYIRFELRNNSSAPSGTFIFTNPQLELGSVGTPFEPR